MRVMRVSKEKKNRRESKVEVVLITEGRSQEDKEHWKRTKAATHLNTKKAIIINVANFKVRSSKLQT